MGLLRAANIVPPGRPKGAHFTTFDHQAFFALRDIEAHEELTFDYKYQEGGHNLACHCGAKNCRKWLF